MNTLTSFQELFNRPFITLWIVSFTIGILDAPISALLPVYIDAEVGGKALLSGELRSTFLILGGLFAVPAGLLCDKIGTKTTYLIGSTGTLIAGFVFLTHQTEWLFLLCIYIGIAAGFGTTAGQTYLIHAAPRSSLGLGSAAFFQGMTLGSAVGSALAGQILESQGFQFIGIGISVIMLFVLIGILLFLPDLQKGDVNTTRRQTSIGDYTRLLKRFNVCLLVSIRFLPTCYWGTATLLIPLLIFRSTGSMASAANYAAISLVIASVCQLLIGRLSDTFGPRTPTLIASTCVAISALCTGIFADSVVGLYIFGITGAAAAWSVSTVMPRIIDDISGPDERGRVVGLAHLAWSLGMLTGSLWGGHAVEWNAGLPFYVVFVGCVMTVGALVLLFRRIVIGEERTAGIAG